MKGWSFSANSLPQYKYGTIHVWDEPLWLGVIGWFIDFVLGWFCCGDHSPLRHIPFRWGDFETVADFFHVYIFDTAFQWYWSKHHKYEVDIEIGYDTLKEKFEKEYPEFFKICYQRSIS